jgi:Chemotaxis phosphatase CheX
VTVLHELEEERPGLETLLADVLRSAFGEEPEILPPRFAASEAAIGERGADAAAAAPPAYALLAIDDASDGTLLGVQVRVAGPLAHALATRMFASDDPSTGDLLDAVGELANILGGNIKALLFTLSGPARLSLPSAVLGRPAGRPPARHVAPTPPDGALLPAGGDGAPVTIAALVLGDLAELTLIPQVEGADLVWPPTIDSDVLEAQS